MTFALPCIAKECDFCKIRTYDALDVVAACSTNMAAKRIVQAEHRGWCKSRDPHL